MQDDNEAIPSDARKDTSSQRVFGDYRVLTAGCLIIILATVLSTVSLIYVFTSDRDEQKADQPGTRTIVAESTRSQETSQSAGGSIEPAETSTDPMDTPSSPAAQSENRPTATLTDEPEYTTKPTVTPSVTPTTEPAIELEATETADGSRSESSLSGRIAYIDERGSLWTVSPDGSNRRRLTEAERFYQFPSWSPIERQIAVIGSDFEGSGVYVIEDERDSSLQQIYADLVEQPIYLYWSPLGEAVSFIASHPDGLALHVASEDGIGNSRVIATSPTTFFWTWMPDGSQVLVHTGFTSRDNDNARLAFVPLDDSLPTTEIVQKGFFQAPVIGPEGNYFSYSDADPLGNHWLNVQDLVTDRQAELIGHQGVVAMGFSPIKPQLAFSSPAEPENSFYGPLNLIDLELGRSRQLVSSTVLAFFWSPDGRSIAFLTLEAVEEPFNLDGAPVASLANQEVLNEIDILETGQQRGILAKIQTPPDEEARIGLGVSIVDVASGEITKLLVFEPSTIFLNQFLPFFDQYALSHQLWSPDSNALVFPMEDKNDKAYIVVVPVDGSTPFPIARGVTAFWSHQ